MQVLKEMDEKKVKSLKVWENFVPVYLKNAIRLRVLFGVKYNRFQPYSLVLNV